MSSDGPRKSGEDRGSAIQVVRVTDLNADAVAEFFRRVWTPTATGDEIREGRARAAATNPSVPGADPPAVAFLRNGEVLGYLGTIPVKFWNGTTETAAHWLKGFMVLPEHRNGPIGFAVLKEMLQHVGVVGSVAVAAPALRLMTAIGFIDCGVLPNYVSPLRPGVIARQIDIGRLGLPLPRWIQRTSMMAQTIGIASVAGSVVGIGLSIWRALRGGQGLRFDASTGLPSISALDELWVSARSTLAAAAVRDGAFLKWRYEPGPGSPYEAVVVRDKKSTNRLIAVAVVRRPGTSGDSRLRGINVATLSDILFPTTDLNAGLAAVAGAERTARRMGADALLCTASHPVMDVVLKRRAFVRIPGNLHVLIRDPAKALHLPTRIEEWWSTRGDGNSDEVF